ncbi:HNH endonuclease [Acidipropionibacterium acidipropionici ATCC 4875]|uniref:HNH endonuclease n=1 Tax=Acidipropionibacterium acidipropionici (strain ATCC 4875 / DSM 20272 / JCM 6432 / NBRC 12425 / NCIMB 8070 / 4) TaxID=1171373 RepID=K7S0Q5_ACIA4|nr:HNH endonuclease signature motif containing protein [Acidipropionibacterium acidipropionici]AFV90908.1 HNH endonuclease [Acidipropionibacterium acidipropionici ATCC 4875]
MGRDFWELIGVIEQALDAIDHSGDARMPAVKKVAAMTKARALADRMAALAAVYTDLVARSGATEATAGSPLSDYLAATEGRTSSEANGLVHQASRIGADPAVRDAALAGTVSPGKAAAIGRVLRELPRHDMTPDQRQAAADVLLGQAAGGATTRQIAGSTDRILEQVAPNLAPTPEGRAAEAERQRRRAIRERELTFTDTGKGSVRIFGQVPQMEGDLLRSVVGACVERGRGDERRELEALKIQRASGDLSAGEYLAARTALQEREHRTTAQRQADALTDMIAALQDQGKIPAAGGETPRVVVTLDYMKLLQLAVGAAATGTRPDGTMLDEVLVARLQAALTGTSESGDDVPASLVRQACCDAGLLPVVLGEASEILDVGREHRLVTPPIRKALAIRDGGCVVPGCTVPAATCQAHHVVPWWAGGVTALGNLVLVCRHHHGLVEPHRYHPGSDQWRIDFDETGMPHVHPPRRTRGDLPDARQNSALNPEPEEMEPVEAGSNAGFRQDSAPNPKSEKMEPVDAGSNADFRQDSAHTPGTRTLEDAGPVGGAVPGLVELEPGAEDGRENSVHPPGERGPTQDALIA